MCHILLCSGNGLSNSVCLYISRCAGPGPCSQQCLSFQYRICPSTDELGCAGTTKVKGLHIISFIRSLGLIHRSPMSCIRANDRFFLTWNIHELRWTRILGLTLIVTASSHMQNFCWYKEIYKICYSSFSVTSCKGTHIFYTLHHYVVIWRAKHLICHNCMLDLAINLNRIQLSVMYRNNYLNSEVDELLWCSYAKLIIHVYRLSLFISGH